MLSPIQMAGQHKFNGSSIRMQNNLSGIHTDSGTPFLKTIYVIYMKVSCLFKMGSSSVDEGSIGCTLGFCREPEREKIYN
jgi:hypothetical protein